MTNKKFYSLQRDFLDDIISETCQIHDKNGIELKEITTKFGDTGVAILQNVNLLNGSVEDFIKTNSVFLAVDFALVNSFFTTNPPKFIRFTLVDKSNDCVRTAVVDFTISGVRRYFGTAEDTLANKPSSVLIFCDKYAIYSDVTEAKQKEVTKESKYEPCENDDNDTNISKAFNSFFRPFGTMCYENWFDANFKKIFDSFKDVKDNNTFVKVAAHTNSDGSFTVERTDNNGTTTKTYTSDEVKNLCNKNSCNKSVSYKEALTKAAE